MCGIAGFYNIDKKSINSNALSLMINSMNHRGPDAQGEYYNHHIGLAHSRLSILDLSSSSNQPMHSNDDRIVISFNGEIYNYKILRSELEKLGHQFKSTGDTEVVLKGFEQWKTNLFDKLNGFFAIAIYDKLTDELYLVRDRIGIKPLYYAIQDQNYIFSSELKGIIASQLLKTKLNYSSVQSFINYQYLPQEQCIYKDVFKVLPGHYLKVSTTEIQDNKYWDIKDYAFGKQALSIDQNIELTEKTLYDSVKLRMQSDVPLGTFLSGGIDSSLVSTLAAEQSSRPIQTFTIGFDESQFDESVYAEKVAEIIQSNHHNQLIKEVDIRSLIQKIPSIFDEPFADSSALPTYLLSQITKKKVTVALSGDGGDELFWGYRRYEIVSSILKKINSVPKGLQKPLLFLAKNTPTKKLNRLSYFLDKYRVSGNLGDLYAWSMENFTQKELQQLLGEGYTIKEPIPSSIGLFFKDKLQDERVLMNLIDLQTYLPDDILTKVDRTSMHQSLEVRVPLLDHRLIEHAFSIPLSQKTANQESKYILKQILYKRLPSTLFERPKTGFSVPLKKWMQGSIKNQIEELFNADLIKKQHVFNSNIVQNELDLFFQNKVDNTNKIWTLFMFQLWYNKKFNES